MILKQGWSHIRPNSISQAIMDVSYIYFIYIAGGLVSSI